MRRPKGGPTHRSICQLRREGNLLTPSTARRGAWFPAPRPTPTPWRVRESRRGHQLSPGPDRRAVWDYDRARGPDPAAASGGGEGRLEPRALPPVRARAAGRSRGVRSGRGRRGYGKVTGRRRPRPEAATSAIPLASQSAQYLLSSSLSSLDRMSWCCSFSF